MSFLQISLTLLVVAAMSAGQVLFKLAAMEISKAGGFGPAALLNGKLLVALAVCGVATFLWLAVLRITPLRLAYPLSALAFILTPLLAHHWVGESLKLNTFIGAAVILAGVWISVSWN